MNHLLKEGYELIVGGPSVKQLQREYQGSVFIKHITEKPGNYSPGATDDRGEGFNRRSIIINQDGDVFMCIDPTPEKANWIRLAGIECLTEESHLTQLANRVSDARQQVGKIEQKRKQQSEKGFHGNQTQPQTTSRPAPEPAPATQEETPDPKPDQPQDPTPESSPSEPEEDIAGPPEQGYWENNEDPSKDPEPDRSGPADLQAQLDAAESSLPDQPARKTPEKPTDSTGIVELQTESGHYRVGGEIPEDMPWDKYLKDNGLKTIEQVRQAALDDGIKSLKYFNEERAADVVGWLSEHGWFDDAPSPADS